MISLKRLSLVNFLSHKDTEIDFTKGSGKILLDGVSGSGKTSIVEAIVWALYGEGRSDNRSLVHKGEKNAGVELVLQRAEGEVTILRSTSSTGKHTLRVTFRDLKGNEEASRLTGVRELQEWIEKDLIGASYLLFVNSVVYMQGGSDLFVTQPANKRKELLLEIVKAEDYDQYYELAKAKLSELSYEEASLLSTSQEISRTISSQNSIKEDKKRAIFEIKERRRLIEIAEGQIKELEAKEKEYQKIKDATSSLNTELQVAMLTYQQHSLKVKNAESAKRTLETMGDLEGLLKSKDAIILEKSEKLAEANKTLDTSILQKASYDTFLASKPKPETLAHLTYRQNAATKLMVEASSGEVCPSGDSCPYMHKASKKAIEYINELTDISTQVESEKAALAEWQSVFDLYPAPLFTPESVEATIKAIQKEIMSLKEERLLLLQKKANYDTYKAMADALPGLIAEDLVLGSTLADVERRVAEAVRGLDENFFDPKKLDSLRDYRTSLLSEKASYETMVTSFEEAEKKYKEEEGRLKEITGKKLPELEDKKAKVTAVKEAFGSNGIKSVVVDYMIPRFEERINEVLSRLSEFQVRLDTQSEKSSGDGMKEGLFITIINDLGEELPYESYSGGERLKITVAISEALASLQKVGFRIYDEMFIGLDEESTESFAMVLERLQSRFSQVVCISHLGQIKDLFDYRLTLTKSNGISMITT